jgi:hypothetical protein
MYYVGTLIGDPTLRSVSLFLFSINTTPHARLILLLSSLLLTLKHRSNTLQNADQVSRPSSASPSCALPTRDTAGKAVPRHRCDEGNNQQHANASQNRVRTLTGKEIELDIESDYKVRHPTFTITT